MGADVECRIAFGQTDMQASFVDGAVLQDYIVQKGRNGTVRTAQGRQRRVRGIGRQAGRSLRESTGYNVMDASML